MQNGTGSKGPILDSISLLSQMVKYTMQCLLSMCNVSEVLIKKCKSVALNPVCNVTLEAQQRYF